MTLNPFTTEDARHQLFLSESVKESMDNAAREAIHRVMLQRHEILEAFIAKYGYEPDRIVQLHERGPDGMSDRWSVYRRTDEQMAELSRIGAQL